MDFLSLLWSVFSSTDLKTFSLLLILLIVGYLFWVLLDEDRASLFRARFFKVVNHIVANKNIDKRYISNDLKGRLNLARKELHCGTMVLPKAVDVQWVNETEPEAIILREGEYIVRLDPSKEQAQNIVHLANIIVKKTTLSGLRHIVEKEIQEAIDINITKKLLHYTSQDDAISWFYENMIYPVVKKSPEIKKWHEKIIAIDEQMLFNTILLVELEDFSRRIAIREPRPYMCGEVEYFVDYLYKIATKKEWEDVNLSYIKAHLRVGTILVANVDKILTSGVEPYITAARNYVKRGMHAIYVIIWQKSYLSGISNSQYRRYNKQCDNIIKLIGELDRVSKYFEVKRYKYIAPNGTQGHGRLVRFTIQGKDEINIQN